jgi:hypothetical protein
MHIRELNYVILLLSMSALLFTACSSAGIMERSCEKNVSVKKDEYTGKVTALSTQVKMIDNLGSNFITALLNSNDIKHDRYLNMYFHEAENNYWIGFKHYSYGGSSKSLRYVYIKYVDDTVLKLEEPIANDEMQDGPNNTFTITFFKIDENDLRNLTEKDIKKFRAELYLETRDPILEAVVDHEKALTIKYLAKCFMDIAPKLVK